jgi:hypothetical protein
LAFLNLLKDNTHKELLYFYDRHFRKVYERGYDLANFAFLNSKLRCSHIEEALTSAGEQEIVEVFRGKYKGTWRVMTEKNEGEVRFTAEESSVFGVVNGRWAEKMQAKGVLRAVVEEVLRVKGFEIGKEMMGRVKEE